VGQDELVTVAHSRREQALEEQALAQEIQNEHRSAGILRSLFKWFSILKHKPSPSDRGAGPSRCGLSGQRTGVVPGTPPLRLVGRTIERHNAQTSSLALRQATIS